MSFIQESSLEGSRVKLFILHSFTGLFQIFTSRVIALSPSHPTQLEAIQTSA
jgi:hypothetical protein